MFQFKTKYDNKIVMRACKYAISQIIIPLAVVAVLLLGIGILNIALSHRVFVGILWIIFSLIYIPIVYFVIFLIHTGKYKEQYLKESDKELVLYDFYEFNNKSIKYANLAEKEGHSKDIAKETIAYDEFIKVSEKSNEYIFFKKHSIIILIPKASLVQGTIEDFNKFLAEKYGDLFKKR